MKRLNLYWGMKWNGLLEDLCRSLGQDAAADEFYGRACAYGSELAKR